MAEINPIKLQKPLKDKDGSFYPLTTYDQIVMPDGVSRFDGGVMVDQTDATIGDPAPVNADTLGGVPAANYALKSDIPSNEDSVTSLSWDDITGKPESLTGVVVEEWTFTLEDGSTVTKKVLTNA